MHAVGRICQRDHTDTETIGRRRISRENHYVYYILAIVDPRADGEVGDQTRDETAIFLSLTFRE